MITLDLQSETYSATGNASSEGVKNQLGRPNLDVIDLLIRETVQNSWDARLSYRKTVRFDVSGWTMSDGQKRVLDEHVLKEKPGNLGIDEWDDYLMPVLAISDRNTSGLGGPTRADQVTDLLRHQR